MGWDEGWKKGQEGRSEEPVNSPRSTGAVSELEYSASLRFFREDRHSKLAVLPNETQSPLLFPAAAGPSEFDSCSLPPYPWVNVRWQEPSPYWNIRVGSSSFTWVPLCPHWSKLCSLRPPPSPRPDKTGLLSTGQSLQVPLFIPLPRTPSHSAAE